MSTSVGRVGTRSARVVVISNAGAARARREVAALHEALPAATGARHHLTSDPHALEGLLAHDDWQPDDLLVVNGGDGSVQIALTALLAACPPAQCPRIACLPGGTTNMTAFDLNTHRRFRDCLQTLRQALAPDRSIVPDLRSVVRVQPRDGGSAQCGLFFGIGTIVQGIEYFHARLSDHAGRGQLGPATAMARTLWGIARHQPPFAEALAVRVQAPGLLPTSVDGGCAEPQTVSARLLLATTLDRLFLGMRPFWGRGEAPLRTLLVERRAAGFIRGMPWLLRGRPGNRLVPRRGYHSERLDALTLTFDGPYTLDGELFHNAGDTIAVCATEPLRFLPL